MRTTQKRQSAYKDPSATPDPLVKLWILRALVPMGGLRRLVQKCQSAEVLAAVGVEVDPEWEDKATGEIVHLALPTLKSIWQEAERTASRNRGPRALVANLHRLSASLGFDETDNCLLLWACLVASYRVLGHAVEALGHQSAQTATSALARILDLPAVDVRRALAPSAALPSSGLLRLVAGEMMDLNDKLTLIDGNFHEAIQIPEVDPLQLLRSAIRPGRAPRLALADHAHLGTELRILQAYLGRALEDRRVGVNVLLYGPPGTGKTELSRVIAQEFGCQLFEVVAEDEDGDPTNANQRMRSYAAAQRLLASSRALIAFDECSDAFIGGEETFWRRDSEQESAGGRKGWFTRALETNPVPTFWLTNSLLGMSDALVRRFDMVIEMPVPPRSVRRGIAQQYCAAVASASTLDALAGCDRLAPAVLTRAAAVAEAIAGVEGAPATDTALLCLVNQTLRAQSHPEIRRSDPNRLPEIYDAALVNTDADLQAMADGIRRTGSARICLYGPPGTGKSAYARWLAQRLDRPLLARRASDVISKWVGDTERNLARAFREAESDGAVLLLDEVDSFLQERRSATHSWQVTEVNEMLTQMESYAGVFVATTNLIEGLDPAALRRFDIKARFGYLLPAQAWELLQRHCHAMGLADPGPADRERIERMHQLTPGDFAAVARRHAFQPVAGATGLIDALAGECALKPGERRLIGFAASQSQSGA
jgi:ATP-dependent 26S proteasome regulatory subunit